MLKKLTFNTEELNKNERGVTYAYSSVPSGNNTVLARLLVTADHNHPFWVKSGYNKEIQLYNIHEVEDGIYDGDLNFNHTIDSMSEQQVIDVYKIKTDCTIVTYEDSRSPDYKWDFGDSIQEYGVADNIQQVKEHFKELIESDLPICISVCTLHKSDEPERDGWSWHKWGSYIGTQNPQREYLYDEPVIEEVMLFHVHVLEDKAND